MSAEERSVSSIWSGRRSGAVCCEGPGPTERTSTAGCRLVGRLLPMITLFISSHVRLSHRASPGSFQQRSATALSTALQQPLHTELQVANFQRPNHISWVTCLAHIVTCVACTRGCVFVYFTVQCSREDSSTNIFISSPGHLEARSKAAVYSPLYALGT